MFDPFSGPIGREIKVVDLPGRKNRLLLRGRWTDATTSDDGRWIAASGTDRSLTVIEPDGDVLVTLHPLAPKLRDLDW